MKILRSARAAWAILGAAVIAAGALACLPDNPYQRWQLLGGTIHANARWIYERIHFDPAPVDVLVVGPSRTERGVNAARLAADLKAQGVTSAVINASLPEEGRNLNAVVVREVLSAKHPKLIVIGIAEKPSRFGHPAFKYLAPARMVAFPGYLADTNYFSDLIYLPYRQTYLGLADGFPSLTGLTKTFDPAHYRGSTIDTTGGLIFQNGRSESAESPAPLPVLEAGVRKLRAGTHRQLLPPRLSDIEFGDERHYVREIVAMARQRGIKVAFLYLPYYSATTGVSDVGFYAPFGPVWRADYLASHPEFYFDYGHLDRAGSNSLTDWLAGPVAALLSAPGPAGGPAKGPDGV